MVQKSGKALPLDPASELPASVVLDTSRCDRTLRDLQEACGLLRECLPPADKEGIEAAYQARQRLLWAMEAVARWCEPKSKLLMTGPKKPTTWCDIFEISWPALKAAFENQTIRNVKLGQKWYSVALDDIPAKHQAKFLAPETK